MKYAVNYLFASLSFLAILAITSCANSSKSAQGETTQDANDTTVACDTMACDTAVTKEVVETKSTREKIQEATNADEVHQLLDGTTWHYTINLDNSEIGCWLKVVFHGDEYTSYYALPSDGQWTEDTSGTYEIEEGRYANTGERYISIRWEGNIKNPELNILLPCDMTMTTDNFQLGVHSSQMDAVLWNGHGMMKKIIMKGHMVYGDYTWN